MTGGAGLLDRLARTWDILRHPGWLMDVPLGGQPLTFGNLARAVPSARSLEAMKVWVDAQFDPAIAWRDLGWLREQWSGHIVIKGVLDVDDARAAADIGASGVVRTESRHDPARCGADLPDRGGGAGRRVLLRGLWITLT